MRCKACDAIIDRVAYVELDEQVTDIEEELCHHCLSSSFEEHNYLEHEHLLEHLSEGPTPKKKVNY